MDFLSHLALALLSGYLAFTGTLATHIENALGSSHTHAISRSLAFRQTQTTVSNQSLATLPSDYNTIPKILIDNAAFQGAAVSDAFLNEQPKPTNDPLDAVVNIFCRYQHDNVVQIVTGTGFIIGRDGVILTNAHVAQFLLLEGVQGNTHCVARTGNPAVATYQVELLYISPAWIMQNAKLITERHPSGTGERDYALLYITSGIDNAAIPATFPTIALTTTELSLSIIHQTVEAAGYPAQTAFAEGDANAPLIPRLATTSITELMTFGSNRADVLTIAGSDIGEQGSSGGPIIDAAGEAVGIISTRGDDAQFGVGSLRGITIPYIDRTITEETGRGLAANLSGNLPFRAKLFKDTMEPILKLMLTQQIDRVNAQP